jgi:hypothetical protein
MADQSRDAHAVMIAATRGNHALIHDPVYRSCIAAAIRAAADIVAPETDLHVYVAENSDLDRMVAAAKWSTAYGIRADLIMMAEELEGPHG